MATFRKILCAVDFSEMSIKALQWAEYLAKKFSSELTVMHSISIPTMMDPYLYDVDRAQSNAYETLENFLAPLTTKHEQLICFGEPSIEIRKKAEAVKASLIVMATSGTKGLSHRLLGSTAEYVMRQAAVPVITISPLCRSPRLVENSVLIPLADIKEAGIEIRFMKDIVDELRAKVTLMHVVSYSEAMYKIKSEILPFNTTTFETRETITKLRKIGEEIFGSSFIPTAVDFGDVDTGILREAGNELYDFILMSVHPEQFLGSIAHSKGYNIVSSAPIPVITVNASSSSKALVKT